MKNITKIMIAVCAGAFTLASCKEKRSETPEFSSIDKNETLRADGNSFELDYRFEYLSWYSNEQVARKIEASMIARFFGEEYVKVNPMESTRAFDQDIADMYAKSSEDDHKWSGFTKIRSKSDVINDRIVAYTIEREEYMGGAHGMETVEYSNYDLRTGNLLTLDDVFTPAGKAALADRIRREILKEHRKDSWELLNEDNCYFEMERVQPTENFLLSREHIVFMYNPYDIACFAQGRTKVTLALNGLEGFQKAILEK